MDTSIPHNVYQKPCYKCGKRFPITTEFFHRDKNTNSGLARNCKECCNKKKPDNVGADNKRCNICKRVFPATGKYFHKYKGRKDGMQPRCKECAIAHTKDHYKKHPEYYREADRNRRARKKSIPGCHTDEDIQHQRKRQKNRCYWCGKKLGEGKRSYHVDHIIPITREGSSNDPSNLVISCPTCNLSRNNKLPHEWPQGGRLL